MIISNKFLLFLIRVVVLITIGAILHYTLFDHNIVYNVFKNNSTDPNILYTVKGDDPYGVYIISSYAFVFFALIVSLLTVGKMDRDNYGKHLELFYKPSMVILEDYYDKNYNIYMMAANLRKLRQYDYLARDKKTQEVFREYTKTKGKDEATVKKEIDKLKTLIENHIGEYEDELFKD